MEDASQQEIFVKMGIQDRLHEVSIVDSHVMDW